MSLFSLFIIRRPSAPATWWRPGLALLTLALPLASQAQTALGTLSTSRTLTPGSYTFSLAAGQSARLEGWGGGGNGSAFVPYFGGIPGAGGGGGAYATLMVTGPATYTATVGAGSNYPPTTGATSTQVSTGATLLLQAAAGGNGDGFNPGGGGNDYDSTPQSGAQSGGSGLRGDASPAGGGGTGGGPGGGLGGSGSTANGATPGGGGRGALTNGGIAGNGGAGRLTITLLAAAAPTLTNLSLTSGPVGTSITLTGTGFTGATAVKFNAVAATTFSVVSATSITATVPAGASTGPVTVTTPGGTSNGVAFTVTYPDLVVNTTTTIATGTYNSITVNSPAVATLGGGVTVNSAVTVNDGGTLYDGCAIINGAGTFTLAAGGTLGICSADGISSSGAIGTVQVTGARSFSPDASYVYTSTYPVPTSFVASAPAQTNFGPASTNILSFPVTGTGLPAQVRNLTAANSGGLSLSQALRVAQVVRVVGSLDLSLNGFALTLPSTAAGTALIVNTSTGIVSGTTATMQRYIGQNTSGNGYRQYSSPMSGETLATLATTGYTPNFTGGAAYNSSATPGAVTPFPTVFSYEEGRTATAVNYYSAFDKGWQAATAGTQAMTVGRGYSVNAPGAALVDFTGQPTTGNVTLNNLAYTGPDGGWQLLGNPYPAPLDWSTVPAANRPNMNAAMYVSQSTGPYAGQYRTYLGGFGDPLIPAGSGFFVRTAAQGTPGSVTLTNANRVTTFGTQPAFGRSTADLRPQVQLTLGNAANTLADDLTVYADPAATTGLDAEYDAAKLPNGTGLNLSVVAATGQEQAITGLPALTAATVLPLHLQVPATGTYQLAATGANLPAGLQAYLRDLTTGQQTSLNAATSLTLTAGLSTRYALAFAPANALATTAGLTAAQVAVFPNPAAAGAGVTVTLPVTAGQQATAEVRDALGRLVLPARTLAVRGDQATGTLPTAGLAAGVYVLRLTAGTTTVSKRLVID